MTLDELGWQGETLSLDRQSIEISGLDIPTSFTDEGGQDGLAFVLDGAIESLQIGEGTEVSEVILSASVNGRTAVQILIYPGEGETEVRSTGWLLGDYATTLTEEASGFSYGNYLQYGSSAQPSDVLELQLETVPPLDPSSSRVEIQILSSSRFVLDSAAGSTTTVEVLEIEVDADVLTLEFEVKSDRADSAAISLEGLVGLKGSYQVFDRTGRPDATVELVDGASRGRIVAELSEGAQRVEGLVVAETAFNSPAASFTIGQSAGRRVNWPILLIGLLSVGAALLMSLRLKPRDRAMRAIDLGASPGRAVFLWLVAGVAVLFPVVFMVLTAWGTGEHAGVVMGFGLLASGLACVAWVSALLASKALGVELRPVVVAVGAVAALGIAIFFLWAFRNPIWYAIGYLGAVAVALVGQVFWALRSRR